MVVLGGVGAALAILSTPVGLIEMIVASSGLSEIWPAAAPPLGMKARLLMALFGAVMAMGLVVAIRRDHPDAAKAYEKGHGKRAQGARKMGFALSKLTALARGRAVAPARQGAPALRRADAHPDAPARTPIFASRDFGGLDIFARTEPGHRELVVNVEPEHDPIVPETGLDMPSAPEPLPEVELVSQTPAFAVPAIPRFVPPSAEPARLPVTDIATEAPARTPVQGMSIAELTERLERGLAQRARTAIPSVPANSVIADLPVAPPVPVREAVAEDVDEALRAALGTLRTMTARAR